MERLPAHDTLYLWWLGQPADPVLIGTLRFVPSLRGCGRAAPGRAAGSAA